MQALPTSVTPFAGLGFDLAPVRDVALCLTVRQGATLGKPVRTTPAAPPPGRWGFGLLLSLSREIRGR